MCRLSNHFSEAEAIQHGVQKNGRYKNNLYGLPSKELHCKKWRHYMVRKLFSKAIYAKEVINGPSSANRGLSTANPRNSHAIWAQC